MYLKIIITSYFLLKPSPLDEFPKCSLLSEQVTYHQWDSVSPWSNFDNNPFPARAHFKERLLQIVKNHNTYTRLYAPHIVHGPLEAPDNYLHKFDFIDECIENLIHWNFP